MTRQITLLKGGVHGSPHVNESEYFFAFARYDPSLFNLIRCLWIIRKGIGNSGGNFFHMIALVRMQKTVNTSTVKEMLRVNAKFQFIFVSLFSECSLQFKSVILSQSYLA